MIILRQHNYSNKTELSKLGWKTDQEIREAVEGTKAEKKVKKILDKSTKEMKKAAQKEYSTKNNNPRGMTMKVISSQKQFSKQDREVVPADIVKKVKDGDGVIQKDHNGDWRIVSMKINKNKSGKPEFWDAKYDSKESAQKALGGYFANKQ